MTSRLVLCIGDLFIPDRAIDIPAKFQKLLTPGKINTVLCLGNLTSTSIYHFLRGLAPNFHAVKGDFDTEVFPALGQPPQHAQHPDFNARPVPPPVGATAPLTKVIQHADLKIGMVHGHTVVPTGDADILLNTARQLDVDVLLWGGTHRFEAYEMEGRFFVNPGSATGALGTGWWSDGEEPTPSFCLMDIQGDGLVVYVYQLKKDAKGEENVSVEKVSFRKAAATAAPPAPAADS